MRTDRNCGHEGRGHFARLAMLKAAKFGGGGWGAAFGGGRPFGGGWDEDGAGGFGRGRHGGRGRMFGSGELRLLLLKLIAEQPRHGYQLIKAIEELTEGSYAPSPGVVYPTLSQMADEELIEDVLGEGPRKAFDITEQGRTELAGKVDEVERIIARLTERGEGHRRGPPPQIARALGNLMMVLRGTKHLEPSEERQNAIVDILDDAAKRIERL